MAIAPMSPAVVVLALALLLGTQPVVTDLYLPALPALTQYFAAPLTSAQLTLSALMACFGLGQLAWGPLADRFGRRPVLLIGLALYVAASVASATAPSMDWLIAARALQGFGIAAAVVCARAMVRDLYAPLDGAHVLSQGLSGLGVIALASPIVGGVIAATLGWRAALMANAVFGAAGLALVGLRVGETAQELRPDATRIGPLLATYARIARSATFRAWTLLTACTYGGLFTFLAGSTFVYQRSYGASGMTVGALIALSSLSYLAGTFACRRWLAGYGVRGAVRRGAWLTAVSAVLYATLAIAGAHSLVSLSIAQVLFSFGHGIHQPCGQAGVVGPFPKSAGAASALAGFILALAAFGVGGWLGVALAGGVVPYALTIATFGAATAAVAWTLVQRHGEPHAAEVAAVAT